MLSGISESSMRLRVLVLAGAAALVFFGAGRLRQMPLDVLPEFSPPVVEIQTEAAGLSANEVEVMVSLGVEELMSGLPWLKSLRSQSVTGLSTVRLEFEPGTPLGRARQVVQERLTTSFLLPNVAKPPVMQQPVSSANRVLMVSLASKDVDPVAMSVVTQWTVKPKLLGVPGVANVAIWGERRRQLQVLIDPEKMRANNIKQNQVIASTGDALWVSHLSFLRSSVPGAGGWIDAPNQRLEIRHVLPVSSPDDLAKIGIDGTQLKLGDVARVVEGYPPLIGDAVVKDGPGLLLVVEKFPGADTNEVTRAVEKALESLRPALGGIEVSSEVFRPATYLEWAIANVVQLCLVGGLLVLIGLGLFTRGWRAPFIGLVAIPLTVLLASLMLHQIGTSANTLLLTGLAAAVAVIIDDVVTACHAIEQRRRGNAAAGREATELALRDALQGLRAPAVFATLIGILAVLPALFVGGLSAILLEPAVFGYLAAVVASFVASVVLVPAIASLIYWSGNDLAEDYQAKLAAAIAMPAPAAAPPSALRPIHIWVTAFLVLAAASAVLPSWWRGFEQSASLLPAFKERDLVIQWDAAAGVSQPEMSRMVRSASVELRAIPGVRGISAHVGRAVSGDQIVSINSGRLWLRLDPKADYDRTIAAIQQRLDSYTGIQTRIQTHYGERLGSRLATGERSVTIRLYGEERSGLRAKAEELKALLGNVDGIWEPRIESPPEEPQIEVKVDIRAASQVGLKPGDVRRAASTISSGIAVGQIFEAQKVFDVVVWSSEGARDNLSSITNTLIELPKGGHVRLGDVASVSLVSTPTLIKREGISQYVDVMANIGDRSAATVVRDVEARLRGIKFPLGYHPKVFTSVTDSDATPGRALLVGLISLAGMLLLMQASFSSWRLAGPVFVAVLLAPIGGLLAAASTGASPSLGVLFGLLSVLVVAARQALALIGQYRLLEDRPGRTFGPGVVAEGDALRRLPITATAVCVALGVAPVLLLGAGPGLEILHPMAITILGGLVTSTITVLYIIPSLYLQFGSEREPAMKLEVAP